MCFLRRTLWRIFCKYRLFLVQGGRCHLDYELAVFVQPMVPEVMKTTDARSSYGLKQTAHTFSPSASYTSPRILRHIHRSCRASKRDDVANIAQGQPTAWDPENLLGDMDAGKTDHFARRDREKRMQMDTNKGNGDSGDDQKGSVRGFGEVPTVAPEQRGFGGEVEAAFLDVFSGANAAPRVLDSFQRLCRGEEYVHVWPGQGVQRAGSFMEGLTATPFPDIENGQYDWLKHIEDNAAVIQKEFEIAMKDPGSLLVRGTRVWSKAARDEAVSYGPNWRTLVLQDRGIWEDSNIKIFPKTHQMLVNINAPTLEVFFARQDGKTGIKSHTDNANFIQTTHLGIDVPEGECWIKVGDHVKEWRNGKIIICDTSFMHETENNSENDRYVLIMRHWHPEVTPVEKIANEFLFSALDSGTSEGILVAQKEAMKKIKAMHASNKKGKKIKTSGSGFSGGFGKRK